MINDRATAGPTAGQSGGSASGQSGGTTAGQSGGSASGQSGERIRLTSLSHGAGCACKLPLSALDQLMATIGTGAGRDGDLLILTKPIGTGEVATATSAARRPRRCWRPR